MDAREAIQELIEVSPQIDAAVVATRSGTVLASSFSDGSEAAQKMADVSVRLLDQAERARLELGREPVVQCQISTGNASVFVVASEQHVVIAVSDADTTVGLVLYDLKTVLRNMKNMELPPASPNGKKPDSRTREVSP